MPEFNYALCCAIGSSPFVLRSSGIHIVLRIGRGTDSVVKSVVELRICESVAIECAAPSVSWENRMLLLTL